MTDNEFSLQPSPIYRYEDRTKSMEVKNVFGTFKLTWSNKQHWEPSDIVIIDSSKVIAWIIDHPAGVLYKYPCGTKRFVKSNSYL